MKAATFRRDRRIRFSDCDPAGIVFYPQYFVMDNGLVEDWFNDALGVDYAALVTQRRIGLPTVRLEVDFRAVSRFADLVTLSLRLLRLTRRSITLQLDCTGDNGGVRMAMRQVLVATSLQTHAAVEIPADVRTAIERDWPAAPALD